jgi:hypothetical protein
VLLLYIDQLHANDVTSCQLIYNFRLLQSYVPVINCQLHIVKEAIAFFNVALEFAIEKSALLVLSGIHKELVA